MAVPKAWFSQNYRYVGFSVLTTVLLLLSIHTLFIPRGGDFFHSDHFHHHHHPPPPHGHRPFHGPPGPPPPPGGFLGHRLAFQERLYQDSVKERQELIRQFGPTPEGSESPDFLNTSPFNALWEFFTASFQCPHRLQRIGRLGDNPKWVCGFEHLERKKDCVVYSIGVSPESSFEASVLARAEGCQVFAYDLNVDKLGDTISSSPEFSKRAFLSTSSIGKRSDDNDNDSDNTNKVFTLSSLMERNGHSFIDILKIDLEDGQLEALEAFFDDNDFPRLASPRAPHPPPRMISRRSPTYAPFLPIGQLQVALSSQEEVYGGVQVFENWWQKLEKMGLRPFFASPRLGARGESLGMIDYSFINIRGDHELVSDHRRPPPPPPGHPHHHPHHPPPPPPPPGSRPGSHMHWYHEGPQRNPHSPEWDSNRPSEKKFGEWELFAAERLEAFRRRPGSNHHHGFEGHPEFPHPHDFDFEGRPPFPFPFHGEFEDCHKFHHHHHHPPPPPPPPPHDSESYPDRDFPLPHEFEDHPHHSAENSVSESEFEIPKHEHRPMITEVDSELTDQHTRKWRPMRGSSKARLGLKLFDEEEDKLRVQDEFVVADSEIEAEAEPVIEFSESESESESQSQSEA